MDEVIGDLEEMEKYDHPKADNANAHYTKRHQQQEFHHATTFLFLL
jgi:hypothetical protein